MFKKPQQSNNIPKYLTKNKCNQKLEVKFRTTGKTGETNVDQNFRIDFTGGHFWTRDIQHNFNSHCVIE